ncbi:MAG: putative redox protein [Solirubrobacterales bacterium]|jgi:putative redox protein|nr:putative redox protein [Solirubrobacterales bacterium]
MVSLVARRRDGFTHDVEIDGGHTLVVDEPRDAGGNDAGPSPTRTVGAALAACTAITIEMYAERKGWQLDDVEVAVEMSYDGFVPSAFEVILRLPGELSDEQRERLRTVAGKCPVHRMLAHETTVSIEDRIESL